MYTGADVGAVQKVVTGVAAAVVGADGVVTDLVAVVSPQSALINVCNRTMDRGSL